MTSCSWYTQPQDVSYKNNADQGNHKSRGGQCLLRLSTRIKCVQKKSHSAGHLRTPTLETVCQLAMMHAQRTKQSCDIQKDHGNGTQVNTS